jgi:kumamolisin
MASGTQLTNILRMAENGDNLRYLVDQMKSGVGVIPFVGAGMSISFGFPSWSGFLLDQAAKAGAQEPIELLLSTGKYEEAAERLLKARGYLAFNDAIDNTFGPRRLGKVRFRGAVSILPQIAPGPVITTNFDHVLEEAFKQSGKEFQKVVTGVKPDLAAGALYQNRRFLLKIHGDSEESSERILTLQDYDDRYGSPVDLSRPLPTLLNQMLLSRPLLFVGCSLNQDRTVNVLGSVVRNIRSLVHYGILEQPAARDQFLQRAQFVSDHNIRPIWYPNGKHEWIEKILAYLVENGASESRPRIVRRAAAARSAKKPARRETNYTPLQMAQLYNFPPSLTGAGETIALIELAGGYSLRDLDTYFGTLGLKRPAIDSVSVAGAKNSYAGDRSRANGEVMMNIEIAGAVAPGASIVVYFAPNTEAGFLKAIETAVQDRTHQPSVILICWGSGPESRSTAEYMSAMDKAFQAAAAANITVCCAAGDNGSADGMQDGRAHVDFPASSPHVLACGGTNLFGSGAATPHEVVWNDGQFGSGGGVSERFVKPSWQAGLNVPPSANPEAVAGRGLPDVAAHASPKSGYRLFFNGQWAVLGGTGAAACLWAGLVARINEGLGRRIGFINPLLYTRIGPAGFFREVVEGNNSVGSAPGYEACSGWNPCCGWGTPDGAHLLSAFKLLEERSKSAASRRPDRHADARPSVQPKIKRI